MTLNHETITLREAMPAGSCEHCTAPTECFAGEALPIYHGTTTTISFVHPQTNISISYFPPISAASTQGPLGTNKYHPIHPS